MSRRRCGEEDVDTDVLRELADLVVLSADPLMVDPEQLMDVQVETTIVGGRVVYERR